MVTIKFQNELPCFKENLNQVLSDSLPMTSLTALANEWLFELTRRPLLTQAVWLSLAETAEEPGCRQVKRPKFCQFWSYLSKFHLTTTWFFGS